MSERVQEIRTVLALAAPVALAELGWVAMSVVDTVMVGGLGPTAIGAIAIGNSAFYALAIFGLGLMLGLDTLVAQAYGRGDRGDGLRSLRAGVALALLLTPLFMVLFYAFPAVFGPARIQPEVARPAAEFLRVLSWSTLPLLLYGAFRRYLQATGHVAPVTFALITANLVNWLGNWVLIYGHWGFAARGVAGAAIATVTARCYMAVLLGASLWYFERKASTKGERILGLPDWRRMAGLVGIGLPAASQILMEIGAFGATAFLAGRLTPAALAAHQIAINVASVTFMVPLGIASAAAVTVGHAVGRRKWKLARRHGSIALGIAVVFELFAAVTFVLFPITILSLYTKDSDVLATGTKLLALAAAFQLFDGVQAVATGALRGLGNTRTAMMANLVGYWAIGLPLGYWLCFYKLRGIAGLWVGLTLALILIAPMLSFEWERRSRVFEAGKQIV